MSKQFPKDCNKDCPHFHTWDMSIDDYTCVCDKLGIQIDECDGLDGLHILPLCPLEKEGDTDDSK